MLDALVGNAVQSVTLSRVHDNLVKKTEKKCKNSTTAWYSVSALQQNVVLLF